MRVGAHVRRRSGGIAGAVEECRLRGADAAQIFVSNPRGWAGPRVTDEEAEAFRESWTASGLGPLVAHAPYLVNIASPNKEFIAKSRGLAGSTVRACDALAIDFLVLHAGAGGPAEPAAARERAATTLRIASDNAEHVRVLVELMAGTSGAVASTIAEAAALLEAADVDGVDLCLDTCHLFAAGYALDTAEGVETLFAELKTEGITDRVALIHANDSLYPRGERRDRHENIGDGFIGPDGWRAIIARPEIADLALILETPGEAERQAEDIAFLVAGEHLVEPAVRLLRSDLTAEGLARRTVDLGLPIALGFATVRWTSRTCMRHDRDLPGGPRRRHGQRRRSLDRSRPGDVLVVEPEARTIVDASSDLISSSSTSG